MELNKHMIYKDKNPHETVECIHRYLNKEFNLTVSCTSSNMGDIAPSYTLASRELCLITNGKGATDEFAQASAYGEFFERLLNLSFVRLGNVTPMDLNINYPYSYYDKAAVYEEMRRIVSNEIGEATKIDNLASLYMDYVSAYYGKDCEQIPCIVFNSFSNKTTFFPVPVADILLGTNGMSAGNTFEEAFVQGYSEILERKAVKDLNAGIVIPDLVESRLLDIPIMNSLKDNLKNNSNINIRVYTFERYYHFPIIALLVIDPQRKEYKIKFGAHCTLEYALERCVSEMVQGAEMQDYSKWIHVQRAFLSDNGENMGIFKDGSGTLSSIALENLLFTESVYGTDWFPESNSEAYNIIKSRNSDIFYVTNEDHPAVSMQVLIPNWSYISWLTEHDLKQLISQSKFDRMFFDFVSNEEKSAENVLEMYTILSKNYPPATTLKEIAQFLCPIQLQYLKLITVEDMGLVVHSTNKDYLAVFEYFRKKSQENPADEYYGYATILAYNALKNTKLPISVSMFFSESVRKTVEDDFANNFQKLLHLNYCTQCPRKGMKNCIHEVKKRVCCAIVDKNERV